MQIDRVTLQNDRFTGFQSFEELEIPLIPQVPGIYAVLKPEGFERFCPLRRAWAVTQAAGSVPAPSRHGIGVD